jgi:hypothetical protein
VLFFWDVDLETDGCIHLEWHGSGKTNDIELDKDLSAHGTHGSTAKIEDFETA